MGAMPLTKHELGKSWTLSCEDNDFIANKQERNQYDFAVALKYFDNHGKFPRVGERVANEITDYISRQLDLKTEQCVMAEKRVAHRRNNEIIAYLNLTPFDDICSNLINEWLGSKPLSHVISKSEFARAIRLKCVGEGYQPPPQKDVSRLINTAQLKYDNAEFERIRDLLTPSASLELLNSINASGPRPSLIEIKQDPGKVSHKNFEQYIRLADFIADQNIPSKYIDDLSADWTKHIFKTVERLQPWEIRRQKKPRQLGQYAVYLAKRQPVIIDSLIDMIIDVVHTQHTRARDAVNNEIGLDARRIYDEQALLKDILTAAVANPSGNADELIWPFVDMSDAKAFLKRHQKRRDYARDVFDGFRHKWRTNF